LGGWTPLTAAAARRQLAGFSPTALSYRAERVDTGNVDVYLFTPVLADGSDTAR